MKALKEKVLNEVYKLFLQFNYKEVTISDIERCIPHTRGAIFYHYKNKMEIFDTVISVKYLRHYNIQNIQNLPYHKNTLDLVISNYKSFFQYVIEDIKQQVPNSNPYSSFSMFTLQALQLHSNLKYKLEENYKDEKYILFYHLKKIIPKLSQDDFYQKYDVSHEQYCGIVLNRALIDNREEANFQYLTFLKKYITENK